MELGEHGEISSSLSEWDLNSLDKLADRLKTRLSGKSTLIEVLLFAPPK